MTRADWPLVLSNDDGIRPAGRPDTCFYCNQAVGTPHGSSCVVVTKLVRLSYTFLVDVRVPYFWDREDIESHRNESSWCANNALDEIDSQVQDEENDCLCSSFTAQFVSVVDGTPHREEQPATVVIPELEVDH